MALNIRSSVYLIAPGAFALGMASYVTAGLIPMIQTSFSVSAAIAAQLVTAFTLAYGLGSPVFVALLPAHRQRSGLLFSLGLFVVANAASALSTDFTVLLIFRAIAGIGAGIYLAIGIAGTVALSEPDQRGKAISVIMGGMASGTVLGVPLSLLLAERFGWATALWLVALLGAIALSGLITKLPALPKAQTTSLKHKLMLLTDMHVVIILLVSLLAAVASLGMYSSSNISAEKFASAIRGHWGIENKLHWRLDVAMNEDGCRIRRGDAAEIFSGIRHIAVNILASNKEFKAGLRRKMRRAAMDRKYLASVLAGFGVS